MNYSLSANSITSYNHASVYGTVWMSVSEVITAKTRPTTYWLGVEGGVEFLTSRTSGYTSEYGLLYSSYSSASGETLTGTYASYVGTAGILGWTTANFNNTAGDSGYGGTNSGDTDRTVHWNGVTTLVTNYTYTEPIKSLVSYTATTPSYTLGVSAGTYYDRMETYTDSFRVYFEATNTDGVFTSEDPANTDTTAIFSPTPCKYVYSNTFLDRLETYSITEVVMVSGSSRTTVATGDGELTVTYDSTSLVTYEADSSYADADTDAPITETGISLDVSGSSVATVTRFSPFANSAYYSDPRYSNLVPAAWRSNDRGDSSVTDAFTNLFHSVSDGYVASANIVATSLSRALPIYTSGNGSTNGATGVSSESYTNTFNRGVNRSYWSGYDYGDPLRPFTTSFSVRPLSTSSTGTKATWASSYTVPTTMLSYSDLDVVNLVSVGTSHSDGYYQFLGLQKSTTQSCIGHVTTFASTVWDEGSGVVSSTSTIRVYQPTYTYATEWKSYSTMGTASLTYFNYSTVTFNHSKLTDTVYVAKFNRIVGRAAPHGRLPFNTSYTPATGPVYQTYVTGIEASSGEGMDCGATPPSIWLQDYPMMERNPGARLAPTECISHYCAVPAETSVVSIAGLTDLVSLLATYVSTSAGGPASVQQVTYTIGLASAIAGEFWTSASLISNYYTPDIGVNQPHASVFYVEGGNDVISLPREIHINAGWASVVGIGSTSNLDGTISFMVPDNEYFTVYASPLYRCVTGSNNIEDVDCSLYMGHVIDPI